eukprot:352949-Chlamydomonas_euryale.AAC.11
MALVAAFREDIRDSSTHPCHPEQHPIPCPTQVWPVVWQTLVDEGVKTVTCEQAESMMKKGWTLVDVRLEADYERQHAEGAINVPLYRPVQGTEFW